MKPVYYGGRRNLIEKVNGLGSMEATTEGSEAESKKSKKKATKATKPVAKAEEPKPFAIIASGGKQYRVSPGDKIAVAVLGEEDGASVKFDDVLMAGVTGGSDIKIKTGKSALGISVSGTIIGDKKNKKVLIFKKKRRGGYTKKQGHRQPVTEVRIDSISM